MDRELENSSTMDSLGESISDGNSSTELETNEDEEIFEGIHPRGHP